MNYIGLLNVIAGVVLFFVSNWIQYTAHKMYADMRIKSGQSALKFFPESHKLIMKV
jgi:hypothetical protein